MKEISVYGQEFAPAGSVEDLVRVWAGGPTSLRGYVCGFGWKDPGKPEAEHTSHLLHLTSNKKTSCCSLQFDNRSHKCQARGLDDAKDVTSLAPEACLTLGMFGIKGYQYVHTAWHLDLERSPYRDFPVSLLLKLVRTRGDR